jgi:alpha-N-arabinofuranosidase
MRPRIAAIVLATLVSAAAGAADNPVPNPSFEDLDGRRPAGWRSSTWGGKGIFAVAEVGRTGKRSALLESEEGGDISWMATVPLEPTARYRLSGWIRTEGVDAGTGRGALLNLHDYQPLATKAVTGTSDWTRVDLEFDAGPRDSVQVNCLLGGWGLSKGKAWFDDLAVEQISAAKPWTPRIAVDASMEGAPISKYIYGQFIEHLGRCIYGGIWAEMLEDRKFFEPVGARGSPWKAIGPVDAVSMSRDRPFAGVHTPEVNLDQEEARGIRQGGLALRKGKEYVGRICPAGLTSDMVLKSTLIWGEGPQGRMAVETRGTLVDFGKTPLLRFIAGGSTDDGILEITATGKGKIRIGAVSLMPADNVHGMRPDTLALLKELDSPVYRWPGGNFVSGYDWRDGIGDPDRRPPRKNPAWQGIEHNDFGIDEFMTFCRLLGTDPYIAVNSGLGDSRMALEELEYANGGAGTPMGKRRAGNGHPEPYGVKFWSIGNEMYGGWQLGHMPIDRYVVKHNEFAGAMRKANPSIRIIAVGDAGPWSEGMMRSCAGHMDLISEHFYCQERSGLGGHVAQIPAAIRAKAEAHRRYRKDLDSLKGKDIRIAMDEWNYWYGPHVFGELGTRYFQKDGLGIAAGLHEYARQSDIVYMANYAQTVNVIGCIKTTKADAAFETTGLVLALYRKRFGEIPAATEGDGVLDAQAAWTADRKALTLAIVNPTRKDVEAPVEIRGARLTGSGKRFEIAADPMAFNDPGKLPRVVVVESEVKGFAGKVSLKASSVTLFVLDATVLASARPSPERAER